MMHARLTIEAGEGTPNHCNLAPDRVVTLGRNRSNSVVLSDKHASRWHAEVVYEDGRWLLRDCGTLNGTRRPPGDGTSRRAAPTRAAGRAAGLVPAESHGPDAFRTSR